MRKIMGEGGCEKCWLQPCCGWRPLVGFTLIVPTFVEPFRTSQNFRISRYEAFLERNPTISDTRPNAARPNVRGSTLNVTTLIVVVDPVVGGGSREA